MDVDYVVAKEHIDKLERLLANQPHGERDEIADDIIDFVEKMEAKYPKDITISNG